VTLARDELLRRAAAARRVLRWYSVDPLLLLSYVVWPSEEQDDPDAGVLGVDRKYEAAA